MKDKFPINISIIDEELSYTMELIHKVTIIQDLSASGKTTLIDTINEYNLGSSYIKIKSNFECQVINTNIWEPIVTNTSNMIYFIDEDIISIINSDFYEKIRKTNNYYVIINRSSDIGFDLSVDQIYRFETNNGEHKLVRKFNPEELIGKYVKSNMETVLSEDSKSGLDMWKDIFNLPCTTTNGNRGVIKKVLQNNNHILIFDTLGFGRYINNLVTVVDKNSKNTILLGIPSLEYLIVISNILKLNCHELSNIESNLKIEGISREQFYFRYLVQLTKNNPKLRYSKKKLNEGYSDKDNLQKIVDKLEDMFKYDLSKYIKINNNEESDKNINNYFSWD